jgi:hypothetical protein
MSKPSAMVISGGRRQPAPFSKRGDDDAEGLVGLLVGEGAGRMAPADLEGEAAVAFGQARAGEDVEAADRLQRELLAGGLGRALADAAFDFGGRRRRPGR